MKRYLFVGDTHGDLDFFQRAAEHAALHDAEMIQVGDWGFVWPHGHKLSNNLPFLQLILQRAGELHGQPPVTLRFVDGNHDHHVWLRQATDAFSNACEMFPGGGHLLDMACPNVVYQPRGSTHTDEDGTTFLFCGGAPSIDHMGRVEGQSIWKELEIISDEEFERCLAIEQRVDVIVTHDAPIYPPGYGPKGDPWFRERGARSMEMIRALAVKHLPELLVHGHWHTRYATSMPTRQACITMVHGLNCNNAYFDKAVMLWSRDDAPAADIADNDEDDDIPVCCGCGREREHRGFCDVCDHPNEATF